MQDLIIYPLVSWVNDLTLSLWQFFSDYNTFYLPLNELTKNLDLIIKSNSICYSDKIFIYEWLEELKERNDTDLVIPYGEWIEINNKYINSILKEESIRIGYVLKYLIGIKKLNIVTWKN